MGTDPTTIDNLAFFDDCRDTERYADIPRVLPDHGRQPRRLKVVNLRDPDGHLYRKDRGFTAEVAPLPSEAELWAAKIARMLADNAKYHAPKLAQYNSDAVARKLEAQILPDALEIAKSLPPASRDRALAKFVEVLQDEIKRHRRQMR
jgi:hypothetical protein